MNQAQITKRIQRDRDRKAWAQHVETVNARVEQELQAETADDAAWQALEGVYTLDELLSAGLAEEAKDGTLSITPLGYAIAVDCGWKVD